MGSVVPQVTNTLYEFDVFGISKNSVQGTVLCFQSPKEALIGCPHILFGNSKLEALINEQGNMVKSTENERVIEIQVVSDLESILLPFPLSPLCGHFLYHIKKESVTGKADIWQAVVNQRATSLLRIGI